MKNLFLPLVSVCLIASVGYSKNLIVNGSFEKKAAGKLQPTPAVDMVPGWRAFDVADPDLVRYELVKDRFEATDGDYYVRIVSMPQWKNTHDTAFDVTNNGLGAVRLEPGEHYQLSFDARIAVGPDYEVFFNVRSINTPPYDEVANPVVNDQFAYGALLLSSGWETYTYTFVPSENTDGNWPDFYFRISSRVSNSVKDQVIHLDNVILKKVR